jgi:hypothetical protein
VVNELFDGGSITYVSSDVALLRQNNLVRLQLLVQNF